MLFFRKFLLLMFIPAVLVITGCGGGGDDDDDSGGDDDGGDTTSSEKSNGDNKSSNRDVDIPDIKDGNFTDGSVHLEYSGGKDFKGDIKGNGIATGGFTLLTFADEEGSVLISFQPDSKDEPGGLAITTKDISTAGEWGDECSISVDDGAKELKGEFECGQIEALEVSSAGKTLKVRVKGNFSLTRAP